MIEERTLTGDSELAELRHLRANPIAMAKARLMVEKRNGVLKSLALLRPAVLFSRIDQERRGGLPAGEDSEVVSKSRSHSNPITDAYDHSLDRKERDYERALTAIEEAVQLLVGIEREMGQTHTPSKRERAQASDLGVDCRDCKRPVACTPADKLLTGFCESCFKAWARADKPDIPGWLKRRQIAREGVAS